MGDFLSSGSVCLRVGCFSGAKALFALCNQRLLPVFSSLGVDWFGFLCTGRLAVMETCEVSCDLPWAGVLVRIPVDSSCCKVEVNAVPRRGALSALKHAESQPGRSAVCCPGQPSV